MIGFKEIMKEKRKEKIEKRFREIDIVIGIGLDIKY